MVAGYKIMDNDLVGGIQDQDDSDVIGLPDDT